MNWLEGHAIDWWWASLLALGLLACTLLVLWAMRVTSRRSEVLVLGSLCALPSLYALATLAGIVPDHYLRFVRIWGAFITTLSAGFVLIRCARLQTADSPTRRLLRDVCSVALALCLGLIVTGVELGRPLDRMAVVVAIDHSRSIDLVPNATARIAQELRVAELGMRKGDRLGVLAFGASAAMESPFREKDQDPTPQTIRLGRDATDIEQAIRRALAELPSNARGKIVLISDGVATRGEARDAVAAAVAAEVPIDVVPLDQAKLVNVRVVSLSAPSSVSDGESFNLRAVIEATQPTKLSVRVLENGHLIRRGEVDVSAGQDVLDLLQQAHDAGLKRYEVQITALDRGKDELTDDNKRSVFMRVRGPTSALVLSQHPEQAEALVAALQSAEIEVHNADVYGLPADVSELAQHDLVVLRDVPARVLSPSQLSAIDAYVRHLGGGLLLMGSDQAMGPGGYGKTPVEAISPVSFDLKQDRRRGSLAEVVAIDYSGSMGASVGNSTKLELANEAAVRSAQLLSAMDSIGVMHVDTEIQWTRPLSPIDDREQLETAIRSVGPGGGGIYVDLSLRGAYGALLPAEANLKHVLLFADGADAEQMVDAQGLARDALRQGITTSVVALGKGPDVPGLERLSRAGSGRFYLIEDAERLPAVFAQETILAARSALNEVDFVPKPRTARGALKGIDFSATPPLHGYVITLPKPRAQVFLEGPESDPILAQWSVGLGASAAFTSDYSTRWGRDWTGWSEAPQLFAQLARSLARSRDDSQVRLRTETQGGNLEITADVLDDHGSLDSYRQLAAHVAGPDGFLQTVPLTAQGPGRYRASVPLERPGAYMVTAVELEQGKLVASAGAELSSSDELKPTGSDRAALARIAREGNGQLRDTLAGLFTQRLGKRFSYQDVSSPLLWSSALLLTLMVAARRLSVPERFVRWFTRRKSSVTDEPQQQHGTGRAASRVLSLRKRRNKERPGRATEHAPPAPTPLPKPVRPTHTAPAPRPQPPPSIASTGSAPGPRKLTAAEILLAKRRNRR